MKKEICKGISLLLAVMLLLGMAACGGEAEISAEPETEEPVLLQSEGALVSFEKGRLTLAVGDETLSFATDAQTSFSLARGFIAGDSFSVSYEQDSETACAVLSEANEDLQPYTLRGTVQSVAGMEIKLAIENGGKASFSLAAAELDLWQGLREDIYVELCCLGEAEGGSCVWVQRMTDHDAEGLLEPETATTEETGEEAAEETSETEEAAYDWLYEPCEDTVWPSVRANLRLGPGMEYPCVGEAECGEALSRCGVSGDWSAVLIDGAEYYIASELLLTERPGKLSTISYDANGGTAAPEAQHKLSGHTLSLSQLTPLREGWHFVSWNTNEKGFGVIFYPGEEYALDGDVTLYAQWAQGEAENEEPTEESLAPAEENTSEDTTEPIEESAEEPTDEQSEAEPVAVSDSSSAVVGTLVSMADGQLCLEAAGLEYVFDISVATLTAERGVHTGDEVTLYYAGQLMADRDSTAAPAVRVVVAAGAARVSGKLTAVGENLVALSLGKTELFVSLDAASCEVGDAVTVALKAATDGNGFVGALE